jgi:hypothetical protein
MGGVFGKKKQASRVNEQDKAVLVSDFRIANEKKLSINCLRG